MLWLGEEFAQLEEEFCEWNRSAGGECKPEEHQPERVRRMDRLPPVRATLALLAARRRRLACGEGDDKSGPSLSRVNAVKADPARSAPKVDEFCDVRPHPEKAPRFAWPHPRRRCPAPAPSGPGKPRWVNVWATWCKPCIEEMPLLLAWQKSRAARAMPSTWPSSPSTRTTTQVAAFRRLTRGCPSARASRPPRTSPPGRRAWAWTRGRRSRSTSSSTGRHRALRARRGGHGGSSRDRATPP